MATPISRRGILSRPIAGLCLAAALILTAGNGTVLASWNLPRLAIIGYWLVDATPHADGTDYVFRARLLNLGPPIPGALATLKGASSAVTILDDAVSFGPVGHLHSAWSLDTAAVRRHGTWLELLATLRWSIKVVSVNQPPTADAGPDRSAHVADRVVLDGSGSSDPDGDPLTYRWSVDLRPTGSVAELSDPSAVRPDFIVDVPGRYVLSLVVSDGTTSSGPDSVEVTTENTPPVADAGDDRTVPIGALAQLDGSGSSDADGDALAFAWAIAGRPAASQATLDDAAAVRPTLLIDAPGIYLLQLVVHDGHVSSAPDTVVLRTDNSLPLANAGPDQTVQVGQSVTLDGSGSTDADGDPLTWAWSLVASPPGSLAVLQDATAVAPSFVADLPGTYVAQLIVNDGSADSAPDTVTISTTNSAPVAHAGPDQTVVAGQVVVLDGSGSSDPDGDPLSYHWMLTARPQGSTTAIADAGAAITSFVADQPGEYVVQLVVNDDALDSTPDTAVVSTVNSAPVADAGPDQAGVATGSTVALDGSASNDADGHPLTFSWALISRPPGSLAALTDATTPMPSFVPDLAGDYLAQLIVNDGFVDGAPDTVRVTAEAAASVTIDASDDTATEAGDVGTFTVARTGDVSSPLEVNVTALGTASNGVDYETLPSTVTIPAGSSALTLTVVPIDDADLEGREGVVLQLGPGAGYVVGAPDRAVVIIEDDDTLVSVVPSDAVASEAGPDAGTFTVSRLGPADDSLTVFYSLVGAAQAGLDYVALPGSVTIAAGDEEVAVTVTPIDDALIEGPETVTLRLDAGPGYQVSAVGQANITIQDDERPAVTIVVSDDTAAEEGPEAGAFLVSRTGPTTSPLTVSFTTSGGAIDGLDYQSLGATVTIPAGAASASIAIVPVDDGFIEGAENVVLSLEPGPDYQVVIPGIAGLAIADNDLAAVTIEATDSTASEASLDPGLFTLRRTGDTASPLTVVVAMGGTVEDADYLTILQLLTIPAGAAELPIPVTPRADNLVEGPEALTLTIQPNLDYVVGSPAAATVTIADDPATVSLVASTPAAREAGLEPGAFLLSRTGGNIAASLNVSVTIGGTAIANRDYVVMSGLATIPAGQTSVTLAVTPLPDNLVEPDETIVVTIAPAGGQTYAIGSPSAASVTITDDPPVVEAATTDGDAAESGLDPGAVTFTRTGGDVASALNVFFSKAGTATNGADYQSLGGALSLAVIPAGQLSVSVAIAPLADNLVEGPETAVLTLAPNGGYIIGASGSASVVVADDPPVVNVAATDPDASEAGPDPGVFTFTRSGGNLSASLTVSFTRTGTATNISDFVTIPSSITIPAGQASMTLTITPHADSAVEGTETVILTVNASGSVVVGPSASATVSIADED
ncbi:MAG: Calx-beta domain-containing protein [Vicinamibacterales bacterium]